ncbi:nucleotide exchange factor GrpE [Clostridium oryzae]|uniref:Protein GrpE n=1 Tax=Clostridium oryzae TaxID=1450648 RepID=A0A1V4IUX9_9CLOT|nr:nucleotide exchange factor GrpE [Clostridium oryzae]OPJ63841.1 protein GrpE [Clostridium oryzae]
MADEKNLNSQGDDIKEECLEEDNKCQCSDEKDCDCETEDTEKCSNDEEKSAEDAEGPQNETEILAKEIETMKLEKAKLHDQLKKANNEIDTLKDRLLRTTSEYENFRKRTAKEKEAIYTDSCVDVLKTLLPVLDNMERAAAVEGSLDDLKKGIEMTIRQFQDSLSKLDVEEISVENGFDPNLHNAVMHVEDESFDQNAIVEVFQKGYKRGDKVIRHSMVKVAN